MFHGISSFLRRLSCASRSISGDSILICISVRSTVLWSQPLFQFTFVHNKIMTRFVFQTSIIITVILDWRCRLENAVEIGSHKKRSHKLFFALLVLVYS